MRIQKNTLVLVADGQHATFFRNTATGEAVNLETLHTMGLFNEADRNLSADRPGHASVGMSERRTSYEQRDLHQANETNFLKGVSGLVDGMMKEHNLTQLLLVAEPTALGVLRKTLSPQVLAAVVEEVGKDYTKTAIPELEALLRQR